MIRKYNDQYVCTCAAPQRVPYGLVVRIRRSHRRGPGSIPGVGTKLFVETVRLHANSAFPTELCAFTADSSERAKFENLDEKTSAFGVSANG